MSEDQAELPSQRSIGKSITPRNDAGLPFSEESSNPDRKTGKISRFHGRSSSLPESGRVIWEDEFGNIFTERGFKGLPKPNEDPFLKLDENYPSGVRVNGLMVRSFLPRIIKASQYMRSHGLATERVIETREIEMVPFKGKQIPVEEWKRQTLANLPQTIIDKGKEDPEFLKRLRASLESMEFVVVERDYPIGERIQDLSILTPETAKDFFRKVFSLHNLSLEKETGTASQRKLDPDNPLDWQYYLGEVLPKKMGRYLAKFHSLGLSHRYATEHNWTLLGNLVDLDSVKGTPIFKTDPPIREKDILEDINNTVSTIFNHFFKTGGCFSPSEDANDSSVFIFIASYLKEYTKNQGLLGKLFIGSKRIEKLVEKIQVTDDFFGILLRPRGYGKDILTQAKKLIPTL